MTVLPHRSSIHEPEGEFFDDIFAAIFNTSPPDPPMKISSFFSPIASAFRSAVLALSKVDGKEGLTAEDFDLILKKVVSIDNAVGMDNSSKATWVSDLIISMFGNKLPKWPWIPFAISWAAHQVAKRLGKLNKQG